MPLGRRLAVLLELLPMTALLVFVFGALLAGWITATECAAWSVVGALLVAWHGGALTWRVFRDSLRGTVRTSCMIVVLVVAAQLMASFMALAGIPKAVAAIVAAMNLGPLGVVTMLTVIYGVLGMFLDGASMILLTAAVVLPMVANAGIDLLWFGIYMMIVTEMSQISWPVGFCLFVVQSLTGCSLNTVSLATLPFMIMLTIGIVLIAIFPEIVLWLPHQMVNQP